MPTTRRKCDRGAEKVRKEREAQGIGSMYAELQPFQTPTVEELVGKRIDVLYPFEVTMDDGSIETRQHWCQGEVLSVVHGDEKPKPTGRVLWDAMPDVEGEGGESSESNQVLIPRKWRKECDCLRLENGC